MIVCQIFARLRYTRGGGGAAEIDARSEQPYRSSSPMDYKIYLETVIKRSNGSITAYAARLVDRCVEKCMAPFKLESRNLKDEKNIFVSRRASIGIY